MASLDVLLDTSIASHSNRQTQRKLTKAIDRALQEVELVYRALKAQNKSPVKQAMNLIRSRPALKLPTHLGSQDATVIALAEDAISGRRSLSSFGAAELLLLQRALRTRRNSLAHISRLPTEILGGAILELCPTIDLDRPDFQTSNFVLYLKISHVCSRWRDITLKSHRFWTYIVLSRPRWALEMLHRSHAESLVMGVNLGASATKTVAARDIALAQLSRIRELHVKKPLYTPLPSSLLVPAPILETFYLRCSGNMPYFITNMLFQGNAPRLRCLSLDSCAFESWESPLLSQLVSLELLNVPINLNIDEFMGLLDAKMPKLRTLSLNSVISPAPPEIEDRTPLIPLDLETFEFTVPKVWPWCKFLERCSIPHSRVLLKVVEDTNFAPLWNAVEAHRNVSDDPILRGLQLTDAPFTTSGESEFVIQLYNRSDVARYVVQITHSLPIMPRREDIVLHAILTLTLDQVSTLTVRSAAVALDLLACGIPSRLLHLRCATFYTHAEPFIQTLDRDPLLAAGSLAEFDPRAARVHYPRLRRLSFVDVAFQKEQMEAILDWLAQRKRLNLAIEELRLAGCKLTSADLGSLRDVVASIHL